MRRRIRAVEPVAPGALSRMIASLGLAERRAERLRGDSSLAVFEHGGLASRGAVAALRKRLVAAQLQGRVDHRSGRYAAAKAAASRALRAELARARS